MSIASKAYAVPERVLIKRALLSVYDKTGLIEFSKALAERGVELISTGGTRAAITNAGLPVKDISEFTDFPEILDGRVKTLHPQIHGGLLAIRGDKDHLRSLSEHGIRCIDLVCVNLYPFERTVSSKVDFATAIENIDIGGPAMMRAAAKNHSSVTIVVDPADYQAVMDAIEINCQVPYPMRQKLAAKAFARTASYDAAISRWFADQLNLESQEYFAVGGRLAEVMRYGENPHQSAALYLAGPARPGVATARQVQGKALSFNNINDTNAAYELVSEFDPEQSAAVAIIKHANPCGVAVRPTLREAYCQALACDPVSAFGSIVAANRPLDADAAREIAKIFTEVIIAPDATTDALKILSAKKDLRLLLADRLADPHAPGLDVRSVAGGILAQSRDNGTVEELELKVVTKRAPNERELADLKMAFRIVKHVKSNAIVFAKDLATVGIGAGQMSRIDAAWIASRKAEVAAELAGLNSPPTQGSVVASDAFFPFSDGMMAAAKIGATAVIQPGGSVRDSEVIAAADEIGLAMVFTGKRHFRH